MTNNEQPVSGHAYRAKLMDRTGRVETTIALLAGSDTEALQQIQGLTHIYAVEVWDGRRLVREKALAAA